METNTALALRKLRSQKSISGPLARCTIAQIKALVNSERELEAMKFAKSALVKKTIVYKEELFQTALELLPELAMDGHEEEAMSFSRWCLGMAPDHQKLAVATASMRAFQSVGFYASARDIGSWFIAQPSLKQHRATLRTLMGQIDNPDLMLNQANNNLLESLKMRAPGPVVGGRLS